MINIAFSLAIILVLAGIFIWVGWVILQMVWMAFCAICGGAMRIFEISTHAVESRLEEKE